MNAIPGKSKPGPDSASKKNFDPEMLYVECSICGRPLIWEKGVTSFIVQYSGIGKRLSSDWLMLSSGCPSCSPGQDEFVLTLARPGEPSERFQGGKKKFN